MDISHYSEKHEFPHYWKEDNRERALVDSFEDDSRRKDQFLAMISNRTWLDVGTGAGGILDLLHELHGRGATLVVVTHDRSVAEHSQRILHLHDGQVEREEMLA